MTDDYNILWSEIRRIWFAPQHHYQKLSSTLQCYCQPYLLSNREDWTGSRCCHFPSLRFYWNIPKTTVRYLNFRLRAPLLPTEWVSSTGWWHWWLKKPILDIVSPYRRKNKNVARSIFRAIVLLIYLMWKRGKACLDFHAGHSWCRHNMGLSDQLWPCGWFESLIFCFWLVSHFLSIIFGVVSSIEFQSFPIQKYETEQITFFLSTIHNNFCDTRYNLSLMTTHPTYVILVKLCPIYHSNYRLEVTIRVSALVRASAIRTSYFRKSTALCSWVFFPIPSVTNSRQFSGSWTLNFVYFSAINIIWHDINFFTPSQNWGPNLLCFARGSRSSSLDSVQFV